MGAESAILKTVPITMSAHLLARNLKKKKKARSLIDTGVENIVGTAMIKETAQFIDI